MEAVRRSACSSEQGQEPPESASLRSGPARPKPYQDVNEEIIPMQRRDFLKSTVAVAVAAELGLGKAQASVPAHNWGKYDFGSVPQVADRLNQGPFPQYPPDAVIPSD